jgi:hypothetical protein
MTAEQKTFIEHATALRGQTVKVSRPRGNDNRVAPHFVAAIRPPRHHADPLFPKVCSGIGAADTIVIDMHELPFDGVGVPQSSID